VDELYVLARRVLLDVLGDPRSTEVANQAVGLLRTTFGRRTGAGIDMAIRATGGLVDAEEVAVSCALLASELLETLNT
jgi:hypothetical protein